MFHAIVSAAFEDVGEADDVAINVGERVFDGVTYASLCCQIDHSLGLVCCKTIVDGLSICKIDSQMCVFGMVSKAPKTSLFNGRVVIVVMVVDANDGITTCKKT